MEKKIVAYDIETLINLFTYTDIDEKGEINVFYLHESHDNLGAMIDYFKSQVKGMVGYNNLGFDWPVLQYIYENYHNWIRWGTSREKMVTMIYEKAQEVIARKVKSASWSHIPQLDLFKIWHFDNKNKSQSLKGLEFAMKMDNVQDMPISHRQKVYTREEIQTVLDYNLHDVIATWKFYEISRPKIDLRLLLTKKYNLDFTNASDSKIGEDLMLKLYCESTGKDPNQVCQLKTFRRHIHFSDVIFPNIQFMTPRFQHFLNELKTIEVTSKDAQDLKLKGKYEKQIPYNGIRIHYGMGGVHASREYAIYKSDERRVIKDADVASLYPRIATVNKIYPQHLGSKFPEVYEKDVIDVRVAAKRSGDKVTAEGLKIAANSVYGKSNSKYSWLYDPMYTLKTTINGQLFLTMLAEGLQESIPSLEIIQLNTDGITVIMDRNDEARYDDICAQWMKATGLELEFVHYDEMVIKDVNNYIAIKEGCDRKTYESDDMSLKDVKYKGDTFEITKDWHKNPSFQIMAYALSEYFVKGVPVEETILGTDDIFLFFGRQRFKSDSVGVLMDIVDGEVVETTQQKTLRYYVSNSGAAMVKHYTAKNKKQALEKKFLITVANRITSHSVNDYDINYSYYINDCNDVIAEFKPVQTSLF